ncbi:DivIVA domain-containing protein [Microbacteriaceae bacterium MWH-Ta3]|nr:DivIVA domain-containing protein [Microbacteriaceae bacterium MWH-Ta3]
MTLTAEDVVNKQFQSTKFREGYDQDEVEEFLDLIVAQMREDRAGLEEARQRLVAAEARIQELQRAASSDAPVVTAAPVSALSVEAEAATSSQFLQLARKLHDQHVQEGLDERERLVNDAKTEAERIVQEAEAQQRIRINELDQERILIERRIEELKGFERDYRTHLKQFLETQLNELVRSEPADAGDSAE